jgi:hypothetical protein
MQFHDGSLPSYFLEIPPVCRRPPNGGHCSVACIQRAYTPILRILYNKEKTCEVNEINAQNIKVKQHSQANTMPNKTPITKSKIVMHTIMLRMVTYSVLLVRCRVSQRASRTRSIPSTKIRAPTTMTGRYPMVVVPATITTAVKHARRNPARRVPPPTR